MQEKQETKSRPPSSLTALATLAGARRWLQTNKNPKFDFDKTYALITGHILRTAISSTESTSLWFLEEMVWQSPYFCQRFLFNHAVNPGYDSTMYTRKLAVRNLLYKLIGESIEEGLQIVFLGSGYDPRPFLIAKEFEDKESADKEFTDPNILVIELDRGQTRENKLKALRNLPKASSLSQNTFTKMKDSGIRINDNLYSLDCDLADPELDLTAVFKDTPFNKKKRTVFIAEGLTPYLSEKGNENLLIAIHKVVERGEVYIGYLTSTLSLATEDGAIALTGENYQFSLPLKQVIPFVRPLGYRVSGKLLNEDRYALIGDKETEKVYSENLNLKREHYFLLEISQTGLEKTSETTETLEIRAVEIIEVPDLDLSEDKWSHINSKGY